MILEDLHIPADAIPLAESILKRACRDQHEWRQTFPALDDLFVSVNVSGKQLREKDFTAQVRAVLDETALDARHLPLEITQTVFIDEPEIVKTNLSALRADGVGVYLDDFGTGYSSLSNLYRFPVDTLKVDRSFVSNIEQSQQNFEIVRTILQLGPLLSQR